MGRLKQYDKNKLVQEIQDLFWEKGISMVGLKEIEEKTGVNKSGLYREFKGKDDIILETMKAYLLNVMNHFALLEKEPLGLENIRSFLMSTNVKGQRRGCYFVKLISEKKVLKGRSLKILKDYLTELEKLMALNLKAVGLQKDLSTVIVNFDIGICNKAYLGMDSHDLKKDVNSFIDIISNEG